MILKNKYIVLLSTMLILGTFFGTSIFGFLPENICENICIFLSDGTENLNFYKNFLNAFSLNFIVLCTSYISGFSLIGSYFIPFILFAFGLIYGFENAVLYNFLGSEHIYEALFTYISIKLCYLIMLIALSENAIYLSKSYSLKSKSLETDATEKAHNNARYHNVKFVTFTFILAIISAVSAYFTPIIQSLL